MYKKNPVEQNHCNHVRACVWANAHESNSFFSQMFCFCFFPPGLWHLLIYLAVPEEVFSPRRHCILIWSEEVSFSLNLNFIYATNLFPFCIIFATVKQKMFVCHFILRAYTFCFLYTTSFIAVFQSLCPSSACSLSLWMCFCG